MTVQKDGEEAVEYSCKKFAAQFAKSYLLSGVQIYSYPNDPSQPYTDSFRATLQKETYKKSKKTGTEKLRCKLGGLDPDLVDDLAALGPFPCTLEFRTSCDD